MTTTEKRTYHGPNPIDGYYLRKTRRTSFPRRFVTLDTETYQFVYSGYVPGFHAEQNWLKLGCCQFSTHAGSTWHTYNPYTFKHVDEFWSWLSRHLDSRETLWVFAHYATFDYRIVQLCDRIEEGVVEIRHGKVPAEYKAGWSEPLVAGYSQGAVYDGIPFVVSAKMFGRRVKFVDTMNYLECSLSELGNLVGIPKLKLDFARASMEELEAYCRNDVLICTQFVAGLIHRWANDVRGPFRPTAGGLARSTFKCNDMKHKILIKHIKPVYERARAAYYGGRIECFQYGKIGGPVYKIDVTSSYPSIMANALMPSQYLRSYHEPSLELAKELTGRCLCIGKVDLDTDFPVYPAKIGGRLSFDTGRITTYLAGAEFSTALFTGCIRRIHDLDAYHGEKIFADYVNRLWELRDRAKNTNDRCGDALYKKLLNTLYGCFGQQTHQWVTIPGRSQFGPNCYFKYHDHVTKEKLEYRSIGWTVQTKSERHEHRESSVAVAACVTAAQRLGMDHLMRIARMENVYKIVTDCIYVNKVGYDNLKAACEFTDRRPGGLRVDAVIGELVIHGPNDIVTDGFERIKGVRRDATKIREGLYVQQQIESLPQAIKYKRHDRVVTYYVAKEVHRDMSGVCLTESGRKIPQERKDW